MATLHLKILAAIRERETISPNIRPADISNDVGKELPGVQPVDVFKALVELHDADMICAKITETHAFEGTSRKCRSVRSITEKGARYLRNA